MGEIKVKDKEIVVPGEVLATGMDVLPSFGTYRAGEAIIASRLGLATVQGKVMKLIPLTGKYLPKRHDVIIGQITEILMSGWRMDLNCAYSAVLNVRDATSEFISKTADLSKYFKVGDYVVAQITNVTSQKLVDVSLKGPGLNKLHGGRVIAVNPNKVPRIIGKSGSMVSMIKKATGCKIVVGQNGRVWLSGEPDKEIIAIKAIEEIERKSHMSGLTDAMGRYLEELTGNKVVIEAADNTEAAYETSGDNNDIQ